LIKKNILLLSVLCILVLISLSAWKISSSNGEDLSIKHRILFVEPNALFLYGYDMILPIESFRGGFLSEVCSYESFVNNASKWKNQYDIFVLNTQNEMDVTTPVSGEQVKTATKNFMDAGVKLILYTGDSTLRLRKWDANGKFTDTSLSDLLGGLETTEAKNFSAREGTFVHSVDYPFKDEEIIRSTCIPSNPYMYGFVATDSQVTFPVKAVQGKMATNVVAYKPGMFFVVENGGTLGNSVEQISYWKYVQSEVLARILIGKDNNVHIAMDSFNGCKIAALGVDCDKTNDLDAIRALRVAFGAIPMEWGLVADKVTYEVAQWYRQLPEKNRIVSHTKSHYVTRLIVTDEIHVIPDNQIVSLEHPIKAAITYIKTTDNLIAFTRKNGIIPRSAPAANQYIINEVNDSASAGQSWDGLIKFDLSDVGKEVKISYTCSDEESEVIGSLGVLKQKGLPVFPVVYTTMGAHSVSPGSYVKAEEDGVIIADNTNFPCYGRVWSAMIRTKKRMPFPLGPTMVYDWRFPAIDINWFNRTEFDAKNNLITLSIKHCQDLELPFVFYMHDFLISETDSGGIWMDKKASAIRMVTKDKWNADWKKDTYENTKEDIAEMYHWVISQLAAQNPYWMTRGEYAKRYWYLNKYLAYDVKSSSSGYLIHVKNAGHERIDGLTVEIPMAGFPTDIHLSNGAKVQYKYENALATAWFDLLPDSFISLEVR